MIPFRSPIALILSTTLLMCSLTPGGRSQNTPPKTQTPRVQVTSGEEKAHNDQMNLFKCILDFW